MFGAETDYFTVNEPLPPPGVAAWLEYSRPGYQGYLKSKLEFGNTFVFTFLNTF